jgi:hypothetical protein
MLAKCVGSGHVATGLRIIIIFAMLFGRTSSSRTQAQCWMFIIDTPMLYIYLQYLCQPYNPTKEQPVEQLAVRWGDMSVLGEKYTCFLLRRFRHPGVDITRGTVFSQRQAWKSNYSVYQRCGWPNDGHGIMRLSQDS